MKKIRRVKGNKRNEGGVRKKRNGAKGSEETKGTKKIK
jgi:hypothetical protein